MIYLSQPCNAGYMAFEINTEGYLVSYSAINNIGVNFYSHCIADLANPPVKMRYQSNWKHILSQLIGPFPSWESLTTAHSSYPELFI